MSPAHCHGPSFGDANARDLDKSKIIKTKDQRTNTKYGRLISTERNAYIIYLYIGNWTSDLKYFVVQYSALSTTQHPSALRFKLEHCIYITLCRCFLSSLGPFNPIGLGKIKMWKVYNGHHVLTKAFMAFDQVSWKIVRH